MGAKSPRKGRAAALGCTREEAAAEPKELGIEPMKLSTLPGFEWLLGK